VSCRSSDGCEVLGLEVRGLGTLPCCDAGGWLSEELLGLEVRGTYFQNMGLNAIENAATGGRAVSPGLWRE